MSLIIPLFIFIVFNHFVCVSYCLHVGFRFLVGSNNYRFYEQPYIIKSSEINHDILLERRNISSLGLIVNNNYDDQKISLIANLPTCEHIMMRSIGQQILPQFKNLPAIKRIFLEANSIVYVKKEVFSSLGVEKIGLDKNNIIYIEDNSFGMQLRVLLLMCNSIKEFSPKWFKNKAILEEININGNLIQTLHHNIFHGFTNLKKIDLARNYIYQIGQGAFGHRNDFVALSLDFNDLKELPSNIFADGHITIQAFGISRNKLTFLTKEFMKKVTVTHMAFMTGNPWQHKCYNEIRDWIASHPTAYWKREGRFSASYVVPEHKFKDYCVPIIDEEIIEHYMLHERNLDESHTTYCNKLA